MVTVRTRKLGTCRLGKPHSNAGRRQTSVGTERWYLEGQSSPRSNTFRFEPRTPERWHSRGQVFPRQLERSRVSSRVSCICLSFWQLQSQPHWPRWWHSVGGIALFCLLTSRRVIMITRFCWFVGSFIRSFSFLESTSSTRFRVISHTCSGSLLLLTFKVLLKLRYFLLLQLMLIFFYDTFTFT